MVYFIITHLFQPSYSLLEDPAKLNVHCKPIGLPTKCSIELLLINDFERYKIFQDNSAVWFIYSHFQNCFRQGAFCTDLDLLARLFMISYYDNGFAFIPNFRN